ncbi:MAG: response regulator [Bacteriovoracaceae bacterium]
MSKNNNNNNAPTENVPIKTRAAPELKIVVVDDAEFSRKTIISILENAKFKVVGEASNANEAIDMIIKNSPNLIILDMVMPDLSGVDLLKIIYEKFQDIYVIIVSSLFHEQIVVESISSGALDFIQKPFEPETIINSVNKIAQRIASIE